MSGLEIRATPYDGPDARIMLDAAHADVVERYGGGDETPVDPGQFALPRGSFLVAWLDGRPVACGGWRALPAEGVAEIKRMYAVPDARGLGVAAALLRAIEESARGQGQRRLVLETGTRHPEAIRFYRKHGYEPIENYGHYRDEPDCEREKRAREANPAIRSERRLGAKDG
jgi:GNAT superfamily N-acetyltransferase